MRKVLVSIVAMMSIIAGAKAQIVYTDLSSNPVTINSSNSEYSLSLAGGAGEFMIQNYSSYGEAIYFASMVSNSAVVSTQADYNANVDALDAGTQIGPSSTFFGYNDQQSPYFTILYLPDSYTFAGGFNVTKFVGFKFSSNNQTHYGWAELKLTQNGSNVDVVLYGYAYESSPNAPILAGDKMESSLLSSQNASVNIYPNPVKNTLTVNTSEQVKQIEVINTLGQKVLEYSQSQNIDVSSLSEGTYYINITTDKNSIVKRIVKK